MNLFAIFCNLDDEVIKLTTTTQYINKGESSNNLTDNLDCVKSFNDFTTSVTTNDDICTSPEPINADDNLTSQEFDMKTDPILEKQRDPCNIDMDRSSQKYLTKINNNNDCDIIKSEIEESNKTEKKLIESETNNIELEEIDINNKLKDTEQTNVEALNQNENDNTEKNLAEKLVNIVPNGHMDSCDKKTQGGDKIKIISNVVVKPPDSNLWEHHLRWPKTPSREDTRKRRNYMPYAIASKKWKEYHFKKEEEKENKQRNIEIRKRQRQEKAILKKPTNKGLKKKKMPSKSKKKHGCQN